MSGLESSQEHPIWYKKRKKGRVGFGYNLYSNDEKDGLIEVESGEIEGVQVW
jgi:hypothetical protein